MTSNVNALPPTPTEARADVGHAELANALRALSMDAIESAQSGHPGLPLGMADVATVLFSKFLKFDAHAPTWPDRDRFILSAGHGSMLLYALLYLTGYPNMSLEEIRRFRQLGSRCAGHPEHGATPGIETTTGPLGQGVANGVGMALAERLLAARFGADAVDHRTYVLASDGDLMEGVAQEAISLAGHLRLHKLTILYDDNGISIDGSTELSLSENVAARFEAAGWQVSTVDGHATDQVARALEGAQESDRPSLIVCRTIIGYGAPTKAGTAATHGSPLGPEEVAGARKVLGWVDEAFVVADRVFNAWRSIGQRGAAARLAWEHRRDAMPVDRRAEFDRVLAGVVPSGLDEAVIALKQSLATERPTVASRKASQRALEAVTAAVPEMIGGSADLTESNGVRPKTFAAIEPGDFTGRFVHYGVREHAMAAIMNGMALHGGVVPYGGTFLVFSDYCRPAIRLAALMGLRVSFVMTHDSIGLGEDGPTHQPVEHLAALRAIPNLLVMRPADAMETAECWQIALNNHGRPSLLALTRQNLPTVRGSGSDPIDNLCTRGAYEVAAAEGEAQVTLLATGSEVQIALAARDLLAKEGVAARVVSMPCWELFEEQPLEYRLAVLRPDTIRIAVEAASPMGWDRYIGPDGAFIGMRGFGASAPYEILYAHFGITPEAVAQAARERLSNQPR